MFRPAFRAAIIARTIPTAQHTCKRFASTAPSRSGTWKGALVRWGAAGALVYYYNTSTVFAEEPQNALYAAADTLQESETFRTVDSIAEQRRARARATLQQSHASPVEAETSVSANGNVAAAEPNVLEEEAEQQGAFNEETGEINWDCSCLGGMAHGPCGEQFRAAFSCFVFSKEEPKGVDCIEHFKAMQNCFREHPEIYGSEMDEEEVDAHLDDSAPATRERSEATEAIHNESTSSSASAKPTPQHSKVATEESKSSQGAVVAEADGLVPKSWHDDRGSN